MNETIFCLCLPTRLLGVVKKHFVPGGLDLITPTDRGMFTATARLEKLLWKALLRGMASGTASRSVVVDDEVHSVVNHMVPHTQHKPVYTHMHHFFLNGRSTSFIW
jgi:hypothetical protein